MLLPVFFIFLRYKQNEGEIKVLKVSPRKAPEVVTLTKELEELQKAVSIEADYVGLIEIIAIDDDTCIIMLYFCQ